MTKKHFIALADAIRTFNLYALGIPQAYCALNDLTTAYHIVRPIEMKPCSQCQGTGKVPA